MLQSISHGSPHVRTLLIHASANKALQASADFTLGWRGVVECVAAAVGVALVAAAWRLENKWTTKMVKWMRRMTP